MAERKQRTKEKAPERGGTGKGARPKQTKLAAAEQNRDLRKDLRDFAATHPGGWSHNEWEGLLESLRGRGHDTGDPDAIGMALERERLATTLERVKGLGPKRREALADRFETLWSLRHASVDEIAALPSIPRNLAEEVTRAVR